MTQVSAQFVEFVKEQLASLPALATARFFGGTGISSDGVQFAMVMGGQAYFVVNDDTRPRYERMGSVCFSYNKGRAQVDVKRYFSIPAEVLEDPEKLTVLARESIRIAHATGRNVKKASQRIVNGERPKKRKAGVKSR